MRRTGWKGPDFPDPRDYKYTAHPQRYTGELPREVDLPETPVTDQGDVNCCVFKALTSLMENAHFDIYLSALWLYYEYRLRYGNICLDDGAYIRAAIKLAAEIGTPHESLWPYDNGQKWAETPPDLAAEAAKNRVKDYWSIEGPDNNATVNNILSRLAQPGGNGVIFGMPVYESFEQIDRTGLVPYPNLKAEKMVGGHCMKAMGYKWGGELIKVKNSWGVEWGQDGYCFMPVEMVMDFWSDIWTVDTLEG